MLHIKIKCKIHISDHQSQNDEGLKQWEEESKEMSWVKKHEKAVNKQLQRKKKKQATIQQMRKSSTKAENKYMVKTPQVTLIAQNTSDILKESGLFEYLCKIYTQIHMYICTQRHYCTYVYSIVNTTALWQVSASDSVCKQECCSCAKLHFCVWLPSGKIRKSQNNSQVARTQMQFHQCHHESPASECFQVICRN